MFRTAMFALLLAVPACKKTPADDRATGSGSGSAGSVTSDAAGSSAGTAGADASGPSAPGSGSAAGGDDGSDDGNGSGPFDEMFGSTEALAKYIDPTRGIIELRDTGDEPTVLEQRCGADAVKALTTFRDDLTNVVTPDFQPTCFLGANEARPRCLVPPVGADAPSYTAFLSGKPGSWRVIGIEVSVAGYGVNKALFKEEDKQVAMLKTAACPTH